MFHAFGEVDFEYVDGCPSDRRAADHHGTIPLEMCAPLVLARMKQPGELSSFRVNTGDVRALVRVIDVAVIVSPLFTGIDLNSSSLWPRGGHG